LIIILSLNRILVGCTVKIVSLRWTCVVLFTVQGTWTHSPAAKTHNFFSFERNLIDRYSAIIVKPVNQVGARVCFECNENFENSVHRPHISISSNLQVSQVFFRCRFFYHTPRHSIARKEHFRAVIYTKTSNNILSYLGNYSILIYIYIMHLHHRSPVRRPLWKTRPLEGLRPVELQLWPRQPLKIKKKTKIRIDYHR